MATPAQIRANQLNAAFSTGPRTPEGKAASARNATKHGLSSAFRVLAHEDQTEFDRLLEQLRTYYLPSDIIQHLMVDRMTQFQWRLSRAQRLQAVALNLLAGLEDPADPDTRIVAAMRATDPEVIARLERYAAQADRAFQKAYRELQILKQREIQAICQPRLTETEVTRIAELPKTPHPSQRPAVQNEPDSPAPSAEPPAPEQLVLGAAIDIGDPRASS